VLGLLVSAAWGAACCAGATTSLPLRVGASEQALVGLTMGGEVGLARWDRSGQVVSSGLSEQAGLAELGAGVRLGGQWQLGLAAPARVTHRAAGASEGVGGGLGDVRLAALWEPLTEPAGGGWVPMVTTGVRLPTGRDWSESQTVLLQDVTGLQGPAAVLGVQLERLQGDVPAFVNLQAELGGAQGRLQPVIGPTVGVGRSLSARVTVLASLSYTASWAVTGAQGGWTARPSAGGRLVYGGEGWRGWAGLRSDLPVPWMGRSALQVAGLSAGVARVF
jgi:hypothetical protein